MSTRKARLSDIAQFRAESIVKVTEGTNGYKAALTIDGMQVLGYGVEQRLDEFAAAMARWASQLPPQDD